MQAFAKSILISILVSVCLLLFTSLIFFFPWYMTLVVETFNLSQIAAGDNYVKQTYYDEALHKLRDRPIFRDKADEINIEVLKDGGGSAIGYDDETLYYYLGDNEKPYRQRGESITVRISAEYPFSITLWGEPLERPFPIQFELKTVGLKHYKDLPYYPD